MTTPAKASILVLVLSVALCSSGALAQVPRKDADIKFRLAQSYERTGDYESALKIYRELYHADSLNVVLIESLKRDLLQLKRYPEAIDLFETLLRRTPNDINLLGQLGAVHAQNGDTKKATEVWERALSIEPTKEPTYRFVGSWVVQNRLFEYAIEIYKRGRTRCGDPQLFTSDIAYLYGIMLNYAEATKEYLSLMKGNPSQLNFVQARISTYTGKPEGLAAATAAVEMAARTDANDVSEQKLLSWLYMEAKEWSKAYDVYVDIDKRTNAGGKELFGFAERALREHGFAAASKAYAAIISEQPKFEGIAQAKFGYARTLEEIDSEKDTTSPFGPAATRSETERNPMYGAAVTAYNKVITEYPALDVAARSYVRIATIQYERYGDLDAARRTLETLVKNYNGYAGIMSDARLLLGEVYLVLGDLERAASQDAFVAGKPPYIGQERERAAFRLAEIDYFDGKFKDALAKLADLTRNPTADATNDALGLQIFIQENSKSSEEGLKEYAKAALLQRQRKLSEAIGRYESILKSYAGTDLIDETLLNIAGAYAQMGRFAESAAMYERLATDYPESIALDRALIQLGRVYAIGLKDVPKAIAAYGQLLEKYPNSIYVSEARKRTRELRGDSL